MPRMEGQPHPHLKLLAEDVPLERHRRKGYPGTRPDRGGRPKFTSVMKKVTARLIEEKKEKREPPVGIMPRLVLHVPVAKKTDHEEMERTL